MTSTLVCSPLTATRDQYLWDHSRSAGVKGGGVGVRTPTNIGLVHACMSPARVIGDGQPENWTG